ncbi:hypothetical protein GPA37_11180 [Listeria monocytogenes]|nr:2-C-methyl-D-erythritol 2,4-cyclodiphosphate synthase [Listeria monocytogenes]EAH3795419.1 2-C-methyl-D-erythritol 2,4-cyclodiphosphate synthase [Listeria monocytogenes]EAK8466181.1 2-C-methyl-D-erythritol 2,4-cyclodiphosphate synthase [Listeria monocytogenes]EDN7385994.1 hypothetical protein [Listeria monocytogenes]
MIRIGQGYDVHKFAYDRDLIIGGVKIPYEKGLLGHSDADGFRLGNLDATIIAEKPKMAPYVEQMKLRIAELLHADSAQVNVKATTTEKLGFTGREEGIASLAVVLLEK